MHGRPYVVIADDVATRIDSGGCGESGTGELENREFATAQEVAMRAAGVINPSDHVPLGIDPDDRRALRTRNVDDADFPATVVDEEAVREVHDALAEAPHELAVHVDLDDRIERGFGAAVGAAAVEDPQMLAVWIDPDTAGHADFAAFELVPVEIHLVGRNANLRVDDRARNQRERHHHNRHG